MAKQIGFKTVVQGIESLTLIGKVEQRENEYGNSIYLTNSRGEVDLDDASRIASEHNCEVEIKFTFKNPVTLEGSE